jgi:type I restriction enzyme, R subunit
MSELQVQDKFLIPFFRNELVYQKIKANPITNSLIIEEDMQSFITNAELNQKSSQEICYRQVPTELILRGVV